MSCEWLTNLKDIAVGLSAATATYFAYQGLDTWRRELKGKSEYQLAKDVLRSVYKVREAFKYVRNPAIYSYEYPEDMTTNTGYLVQEHKADGTLHVYQERWKRMDDAFKELEELFLKALVEWGSEYQDVILDLRKLRGELLVDIQHLVSRYRYPTEEDWMNKEQRRRHKAVIYYSGEESKYDTFTPEIDLAIAKFDTWLRPHISRE